MSFTTARPTRAPGAAAIDSNPFVTGNQAFSFIGAANLQILATTTAALTPGDFIL